MAIPETDKPVIEPLYSQATPSQQISLGDVNVEFTVGDKTCKSRADVIIRFTPDERLLFVIPADDNDPLFGLRNRPDDDWSGKLRLTDRDVTLDVFWVGSGDDYGALAFIPKTSAVTVSQPSDHLTVAILHLFNFPDFSGPEDYAITIGDSARRTGTQCGRVILKVDGWIITIAATERTTDLHKALKLHGGFVITHMGKIERGDGSPFSTEQLEDLVSCVHHYLSFALGRWAGVALPIGFNDAGERAFEQWGMPLVASGPWKGSCSWFDARHSEILVEVFPGFVALWKDESWNRAIRAALYWYLGANERGTGVGVDTGLVLAQTALEQLAWAYCVRHRKMISADAFEPRGLSAADKLRLLVSTLDLPLNLPDPKDMPALHAKRGRKWQDATEAITNIRNSIVHPQPRERFPEGSYYEAWKLSLWYLDMILLRLCGHRGKYANRLAQRCAGVVEPVPWAQPETAEERGD